VDVKNSLVLLRRCLLYLALVAVSAPAAELTIVRAFSGWRDAASFKRISEYFDGKENTGGRRLIRSHPDQRAGYYFLIRTANPGAPAAVKIALQLSLPGDPKLRSFSFPADLPAGETVIDLGLTGPDWPDAKTNPMAWKLEILAADGRVLATEKSYLWEKPATP
jgi:hypothetical protein